MKGIVREEEVMDKEEVEGVEEEVVEEEIGEMIETDKIKKK